MDSWTLEALELLPTRNIQGGHYFLNLHTGRVITCFTWTALPLPTSIHKLVRRIVRRSSITLEFLDGLLHKIPDAKPYNDEADEDYVPREYD